MWEIRIEKKKKILMSSFYDSMSGKLKLKKNKNQYKHFSKPSEY